MLAQNLAISMYLAGVLAFSGFAWIMHQRQFAENQFAAWPVKAFAVVAWPIVMPVLAACLIGFLNQKED